MALSIFELFSIGVGPSSSHTIGPMKASSRFLRDIPFDYATITSVKIELFGSLALTGKGHWTDKACLLGLSGYEPDTIDPDIMNEVIESICNNQSILLNGHTEVIFNLENDIIFNYFSELPYHANGLRFTVQSARDEFTKDYYSIGGGFILSQDDISNEQKVEGNCLADNQNFFTYDTWNDLYRLCFDNEKSITEIVLYNEILLGKKSCVRTGILNIWNVMKKSIERGLNKKGLLPGSLKVERRASKLYQKLINQRVAKDDMNWLNIYAIAVNEENASGGRIVTAPTNGAAGIIPSILYYYLSLKPESYEDDVIKYLCTTSAIGVLFKKGSSISAAEVGCQGEVGVACAMAAAGLCALYGGSLEQIANAAEMGMEHNLGLTCDPIGGLVQIPCIERNAMGAVQAINAAKLAMLGDGKHHISLDTVIATMKQTGLDMSHKYKETSLGGLAVNLPAC